MSSSASVKVEIPASDAISVTHDRADAIAIADRLLVLEAGRVSQLGSWPELAAAPATTLVRQPVAGDTNVGKCETESGCQQRKIV